jgi:CheY-like chemotaxis protein
MRWSVLIVDDELGLADLLAEILRHDGHDVRMAMHGRQALKLLSERPVDVVLSDVMMPLMDGGELAAAMRSTPALARIPIVLMTALPEALPTDTRLYDAVLIKPFGTRKLMSTLTKLLGAGR